MAIQTVKTTITPYEAFCLYYLPHWFYSELSPLHYDILNAPFYSNEGFHLYECHRESGKSTALKGRILAELCLGCFDDHGMWYTVLISDTDKLVAKHTMRIMDEFENNPLIQRDFGDFKLRTWSKEMLHVVRPGGSEFVLEPKGTGAAIRGDRANWLIFDDLENDKQIKTKAQREKLSEWFHKAALSVTKDGGLSEIYGTPISTKALLVKLKKSGEWDVHSYPALIDKTVIENGRAKTVQVPFWPAQWSLERLEQRRRKMFADKSSDDGYKCEFLLQPGETEHPIFMEETIGWFDSKSIEWREIQARGIFTVLSSDPAVGEDEADDLYATTAVSVSLEREPKYYVRLGHHDHLETNQHIVDMFADAKEVRANKVVFEEVAFSRIFQGLFKQYALLHKHRYPVEGFKRTSDKRTYAYQVVHLFNEGRVFFDLSRKAELKWLIDELVAFDGIDDSVHDDGVDSLCAALIVAMKRAEPKSDKTERGLAPNIATPPGMHKNPITGVTRYTGGPR